MQRAAILTVVLGLVVLAPGGPDAGAAKKTTLKCPDAKVPQIKHGRFTGKCAAVAKPKRAQLPEPSGSRSAQMGAVADQIEQALAVRPQALARLERKVGKRRARKLVALGLDSWRNRAVAAETKSDTYSSGKGVDMSFKGDFRTVDTGGQAGYTGEATVEGTFTRDGLDKLIKDKTDVELPKEVKDGRLKVELSFSDLPAVCPDAQGKVKGSLKAAGKLTLTVGSVQAILSAKIDATYNLTVGEDARWHTIDDLDVKTEFQIGGTGRSTETWRGRNVGSGFGTEGIFGGGAAAAGAAIERDFGHLDPNAGGMYGPHGGINNSDGVGTRLWSIRSVDNAKGLIATSVATQLATLAVAEYVRQVAAARVQKRWYDDEACLKLDASAAKAKLKAGETTSVTAKNARAADGTPVSANLTASGTKSLEPGSAALPANGSKDFTLTAPNAKPAKSHWKVQALSRSGKKTVEGDLGDTQGPYTVTLDDHETGHFATHDATGHLTGTLTTVAVAGSSPERWTASAPVTWSDLTATSKMAECSYADPQSGGAWTATVTAVADDRIRVELEFTAETTTLWTVVCEGASVPGQAGTSPVGMTPRSFELSAGGGTQPLSGSVTLGADGFFTDGTITVTPSG